MIKELKKRKRRLEKYIAQCEANIAQAPFGTLKITKKNGHVYYFRRESTKDTAGRYLKDGETVRALACKDYYIKVKKAAEEELEQVEEFLAYELGRPVSQVYGKLSPERKQLVVPFEDTLENYIRRWQEREYSKMEPRTGSYVIRTSRGEFVRSKAEYNIAEALFRAGIPYRYEPDYLTDDGVNQKPDFIVLNVSTGEEFYWEHFGMMDRPDYVKKFMNKMNSYELSGLYPGNGLIVTFEDNTHKLESEHIDRIIRTILT